MTDKSYVSLGQHICKICGNQFDSGEVLLDKRLRNSLERTTVTGWGICPKHAKLIDDGYIALIGVDETKSKVTKNGTIRPEDAHRTGSIAFLRRSKWPVVFNSPPTEDSIIFAADEVIEWLNELNEQAEAHQLD